MFFIFWSIYECIVHISKWNNKRQKLSWSSQSSLSDLIIKSESLLDFEQKLAYLTSDNSLGFFLVVFWTANWWHINKHVNYCPFFLLLTNQTSRYTQSNTHKLCYLHCAQFARILLCCFVGTLSHETLKHSFAKPLFLI